MTYDEYNRLIGNFAREKRWDALVPGDLLVWDVCMRRDDVALGLGMLISIDLGKYARVTMLFFSPRIGIETFSRTRSQRIGVILQEKPIP